ncbi:DUF2218 domain-containing protein [Gymnodinialimonas sp.]
MTRLARFETDRAVRHLETLCKHFGRKVAVHCDGRDGWVQFPFGRCEMRADERQLEMRATAEDASALAIVVQVMTSHLERFAFRENPVLDWQVAPD